MTKITIEIYNVDGSIRNKYKKLVSNLSEELSKFFKFYPKNIVITFHKDRESFDKFWGSKTENWMVGFNKKNTNEVHLINPHFYEKLSVHKYSKNRFNNLIKHELVHLFINQKYKKYPNLFNEGLALYMSDLYLRKKVIDKVKEISNVPDFETLFFFQFDYMAASVFSVFLEFLDDTYGTEKLKSFIDELKNNKYDLAFKSIYVKDFQKEYKNSFLKWLIKQ